MSLDTMESLAGKSVIVTGGASGIGHAVSIRLAQCGCNIAVADINEDAINQALEAVRSAAPDVNVLGVPVDVRSEEQVSAMASRVNDAFGSIDILVHSAGILRPEGTSPRFLPQIEDDECNAVIDINLKGTFLCNRAVLQYMMVQRSGQILNISSTSGLKGLALDSVYCASKSGVIGLTESLAEEVRPFGIRVHCLLPNAVNTPLWDANHVGAPGASLAPDRVALTIELMLSLPGDMVLQNVIVAPLKSRRRKKKKTDTGETAG